MEITNITASASRKINHALYGGEQFESSDHFASLSAAVEEGEDILQAHRELMMACKEMVNTSVSNEILKMQGGIPWNTFMELLKEYRLKRNLNTDMSEHAQKMTTLQKSILNEMKLLMRDKAQIKTGPEDITYETVN